MCWFSHGYKLLTLFWILCVCQKWSMSCEQDETTGYSKNVTKIIEKLLKKTQNKLCRPYMLDNTPVTIKTDIKLMHIGNFREADMQYTVEMYFRQSWYDPRLAFGENGTNSVTLNGDLSDFFWQPDTIFENEVEGKVHTLLAKNKFFRIHKDGRILTSTRLTLTCSCLMDFKKFPMDEQECGIYLASYGYTTEDIVYEWQNTHETWTHGNEIPQFILKNISMINTTRHYLTGDYSALGIKFVFTRRLGHYFTKVYIPAILIVMLSWLSFYVDRRSAPARVSLGITTVLTMTTLLIGVGQGALPVVAYVKALDWYLFVSYFMVFAAFAEYAVINYRENTYQRARSESKLEQNGDLTGALQKKDDKTADSLSDIYANVITREAHDFLKSTGSPQISTQHIGLTDWFTDKFLTPPDVIDTLSKTLFPLFFIIFNLLYWIYYLVISD